MVSLFGLKHLLIPAKALICTNWLHNCPLPCRVLCVWQVLCPCVLCCVYIPLTLSVDSHKIYKHTNIQTNKSPIWSALINRCHTVQVLYLHLSPSPFTFSQKDTDILTKDTFHTIKRLAWIPVDNSQHVCCSEQIARKQDGTIETFWQITIQQYNTIHLWYGAMDGTINLLFIWCLHGGYKSLHLQCKFLLYDTLIIASLLWYNITIKQTRIRFLSQVLPPSLKIGWYFNSIQFYLLF